MYVACTTTEHPTLLHPSRTLPAPTRLVCLLVTSDAANKP